MEFSRSGREKRFAAFDASGLVATKADLASTDRSAIGSSAAVSVAWEWVVMKESAASETGKKRKVFGDRVVEAGDRRASIATVDWKAVWRRLWRV